MQKKSVALTGNPARIIRVVSRERKPDSPARRFKTGSQFLGSSEFPAGLGRTKVAGGGCWPMSRKDHCFEGHPSGR